MTDIIDVVDNFKLLLWDPLVDKWLKKILGRLWGPLASIIITFVTKYLDDFYKDFRENLIVSKFIFKNAEHEAAFNRKDLELTLLDRDPNATPEEIRKARDAAKLAMSEYTRIAPKRL